ncbi:MAG: hypothetical protein ACREJ2_09045 [Planctomycetota bacterium]
MDEHDRLLKRCALAGGMLAHAANAHEAMGALSRADLRADATRVQKITTEVVNLCTDAAEFTQLGGHVIDLDSLLKEAGLPPAKNISPEALPFKKLYPFVRNSLPVLVKRLQKLGDSSDHALSRLQDEEDYEDVNRFDDELSDEEIWPDFEPDENAALEQAPHDPEVPILVGDYAVPDQGDPAYGSVLEDGRHLARPFVFTRLDLRIEERVLWEELAQQSGQPLDPGMKLVFDALACEDEDQQFDLVEAAIKAAPDCVDAQVLYAAQWSDSLDDKIPLFQKSMDTAERQLGPAIFQSEKGRFWENLITRPYMRARAELAECLSCSENRNDAPGHWEALLELDPVDHQGNREQLLVAYTDLGRLDLALALHERFRQDRSTFWLWSRANLNLRSSGDSEESRKMVQAAVAANPHVKDYLTMPRNRPMWLWPESYTRGSESEALHYFEQASHLWRRYPGALSWLKKQK